VVGQNNLIGGKYQSKKVSKGTATRPENKGSQRAMLPNIVILCVCKEITRHVKRMQYIRELMYIKKHFTCYGYFASKKMKTYYVPS